MVTLHFIADYMRTRNFTAINHIALFCPVVLKVDCKSKLVRDSIKNID